MMAESSSSLSTNDMSSTEHYADEIENLLSSYHNPKIDYSKVDNTTVFKANWMNNLYTIFMRSTLLDFCLMGSHDTLTYDLTGTVSSHDTIKNSKMVKLLHAIKGMTKSIFINLAKTQQLSVRDQLNAGVRKLDIRTLWERDAWYGSHTVITR